MPVSDVNQLVGKRLQRLREARHWSMAELAGRCSGAQVTASQINKLEKGRQQFTVDWLLRISAALECSACELIEDRPIGLPADDRALFGRILELAEPQRELVRRLVGAISPTIPKGEDEEPS